MRRGRPPPASSPPRPAKRLCGPRGSYWDGRSEEVELPDLSRQETKMKLLPALGLILALMPSTSPSHAAPLEPPTAPPEPPAVSLRVIQTPCSLAKVCQTLSREFKTSVSPDPALAD